MIWSRKYLAGFCLLPLAAAAVESPVRGQESPPMLKPRPGVSGESYHAKLIEGWDVLVSVGFLQRQPELAAQTLRLLDAQLYQVTRVLPAEVVAKLRRIRIWVEEDRPHPPHPSCMAYHPDENWLREHGVDPRKARCIEIANVRNFLKWSH